MDRSHKPHLAVIKRGKEKVGCGLDRVGAGRGERLAGLVVTWPGALIPGGMETKLSGGSAVAIRANRPAVL
jgi:hypothetical protein